MSDLRIAYIGPGSGTSLHRARAMERLGHSVTIIDPWAWLGSSPLVARWLWHMGGAGVGLVIDRRIRREVVRARPDIIWIDQGPFLGRRLLRGLRVLRRPIVNYTIDNPFSRLHHRRFRRYRRAIPELDLLAVVRETNVEEARAAGARNIVRVWMSADEVAHSPRRLSSAQQQVYSSEVAFVGTWMPERGPFLAALIRRGVPLSIWGDRWQKAPEWSLLQTCWRGPGLFNEDAYAAAIQSAKVCLGLVSAPAGDLHTTRTMEIPALGGLLCAQRTSEHLSLYDEGREAVFWSDAQECGTACLELLKDQSRREQIAAAGYQRALLNGHFNEATVGSLIDVALSSFSRQG